VFGFPMGTKYFLYSIFGFGLIETPIQSILPCGKAVGMCDSVTHLQLAPRFMLSCCAQVSFACILASLFFR